MSRLRVCSYVGGRFRSGGDRFEVINPATGAPCGLVSGYTADDLDEALTAARDAFPAWSSLPPAERCGWMTRLREALLARREAIQEVLVAETGKPWSNAEYDFGMLTTCLEFYAQEVLRLRGEELVDPEGLRTHRLVRHPLGVVVVYLAWNFPLLNLGYKLGPLLASGCTGIIKPSRTTPLATALVAQVIDEIGLPAGVVNLVLGEDRELADRLLTSDIPSMVTMIGSTQAGCQVMATAATSVKRFSMELGGNAPVLVYADCDLPTAVQRIVDLKLTNAGQVCVSPNRCFVHERLLDEFVERAAARMAEYELGAGRGPELLMGPLSAEKLLGELLGKLERAVRAGATVVCGGRRVDRPGYWLEPTLVRCDRDSELCTEEIFGPILPVIAFSAEDDVVAWANDTPAGLASYVFSSSEATIADCVRRLESGSICVNEPYYSIELPHGGLKQSGVGKDCSHLSLEEYYAIKRVTIRPAG